MSLDPVPPEKPEKSEKKKSMTEIDKGNRRRYIRQSLRQKKAAGFPLDPVEEQLLQSLEALDID